MKISNYVDSDDQFAFQFFWAVSQALYSLCIHFVFTLYSLCIHFVLNPQREKSRQNRFVTKITGESVLNNLIDLLMFNKQVIHGKWKWLILAMY